MPSSKSVMSVVGVIILVLVILYFISWYRQDSPTVIYSGIWMLGLTTPPNEGCVGSPKTCGVDANMQTYSQYYYTCLSVGSVDPTFWDGSSGSQSGLIVGSKAPLYAICPLDQQGSSSYNQWQFKNISIWNAMMSSMWIEQPMSYLYNVGIKQYLVPVAGDFPQGSLGGWAPPTGSMTASSPPNFLAHTFQSTVKADYKTLFPHYWRIGQYFVPDNAVSGGKPPPIGTDPMNGKQVSGMTVLACYVWFPDTAGATSGSGKWFTYYAQAGSSFNAGLTNLGGPINLNLSTNPPNGRFHFGNYWNRGSPVNATKYVTSMAGGSTPNSATGNCNNGSPNSSGVCACKGNAFGFNCLFPSPSTKSPTSFSPPHKYSSSTTSTSTASAPTSAMPASMMAENNYYDYY